jgi:hypothetical protein
MSKQTSAPTATLAKLALPVYVLAMLFMVMPPADLLLDMPNIDPSSVRWRFGAVGLLVNALLLPMAGLFMFLALALVSRQKWAYRIGQVMAGAIFLLMFVGLFMFALDALQVRNDINPQLLQKYDITVGKTIVLQLIQLATVFTFVWTGRKVARSVFVKEPREAHEGALVMGAPAR